MVERMKILGRFREADGQSLKPRYRKRSQRLAPLLAISGEKRLQRLEYQGRFRPSNKDLSTAGPT